MESDRSEAHALDWLAPIRDPLPAHCPVKGAGILVSGKRAHDHAPPAGAGKLLLPLLKQAPPKPGALIFGLEIELVDFPLSAMSPVSVRADYRIAGGDILKLQNDRTTSGLHLAPEFGPALCDHPLKRDAGDDATIGRAPGITLQRGKRFRICHH